MGFAYPLLCELAPAEPDFEHEAKETIHVEGTVRAAPHVVYDHIVRLERASEWLAYFCGYEWQTAEHEGPGSTYDETFGFMTIRVRTLIDQPGARWNAGIDRCSAPFASKMGEDVRFTADGAVTRVSWKIYYDPKLLLRPVAGLGNAFFHRMLRKSLEQLDQLLGAS